jgi:hypothetical protein
MTPQEQELVSRSDRWDEVVATRDQDAALTVLDEDFALVLVHPTPARVPLSQWLATLPDYVVHSWEVQERQVDISADVGAILQRVDMRATVLGQDRSGIFLVSDIWRRRDGEWWAWRRHSSPLTAGPMP